MAISKDDILEAVSSMTVMELNDLVRRSKRKVFPLLLLQLPAGWCCCRLLKKNRVRRGSDRCWRQQGWRDHGLFVQLPVLA